MQLTQLQHHAWAWLICCSGILLAVAIEGCDLGYSNQTLAQHASRVMQDNRNVLSALMPNANAMDSSSPTQPIVSLLNTSHSDVTPTSNTAFANKSTLLPKNMPLGRYVQQLKCQSTDCIVRGDAELIMTFLPNGTVHRSLIHLGQMSVHRDYAHSRAPIASLDRWYWNAATQQVVVNSAQGAQLTYRLDAYGLHFMPQYSESATQSELDASSIELNQAPFQAVQQVWQRRDDS